MTDFDRKNAIEEIAKTMLSDPELSAAQKYMIEAYERLKEKTATSEDKQRIAAMHCLGDMAALAQLAVVNEVHAYYHKLMSVQHDYGELIL